MTIDDMKKEDLCAFLKMKGVKMRITIHEGHGEYRFPTIMEEKKEMERERKREEEGEKKEREREGER